MSRTRPAHTVRTAKRRDLDQLVELWIEVYVHHANLEPQFRLRQHPESDVRQLLESQLRDPNAAVFVSDSPTGLSGFCIARIDRAPPLLQERERAEITDLGVRSEQRRRGTGRALARAALDWARERGAPRIEARVAAANKEGQAFWRSLEFADLMDVLQRRL